MATVTITFTDTADGEVTFHSKASNAKDPKLTFANLYGFAFMQFEDEIVARAQMLYSLYKKGMEDGRDLSNKIEDNEIDEDDLEIERQEEDFYNGPR